MLSPRYWIFFLIVLAAIGYSMLKPDTLTSADSSDIITSPADPFSYRYLELDNGLKVVLINTPNTDKAAAAMTVSVGSGDDPDNRNGLAHFLEHMLFLGTDPYPEPGEYQAYISRNGGSHNAFTAHAQTTYFYEIENDAMAGALDRFAPFFISPRFDEAYVDREKNAVHAEFQSKLKDDFRRIFSAEKQAMNPEHPYAKFSTGNLDTLSDTADSKVRDDLLAFYKEHYSSDRMTLVLAGDYPLEQLEEWARSHFSAVPKREIAKQINHKPLFVEGQLPLDMNIEPVKEIRRLQFTFPMPEVMSLYDYKPVQLLSNLIGHEGEGSLLAYLKQQGWAEALSSGRAISTENESALTVQISLTRLGLLHTENITQALMHYFELMKVKPFPEYLKTEQQQLNELTFRYLEHGQLSDYVVRVSTNMQLFPVQDIIYGNYKALIPTDEQMRPYLNALSANNMLRTLIAPGVVTDMVDPWYATPMRIRPSDYAKLDIETNGLDALHLPVANPFIPTDFSLHAGTERATPTALIHNDGQQAWYYPENEFKAPKSQIILRLALEPVQQSARQQVLAKLYARAINEALNTYSYPASLAGLNYSLSATNRGLDIGFGGYQDKLPELMRRVLSEMNNLVISDDEFERYRASLQRSLENNLKAKPFQRTIAELKHWLYEPSFNEDDLLAALADVNREDVINFANEYSNDLSSILYVHGNVSEKDAKEMADIVAKRFPANASTLPLPEVKQLPEGQFSQVIEQEHPDNAFSLYIQGQATDDNSRARMSLLTQILSAPYYQYMRTEQQLGYVVVATAFPQQTVPGLLFVVQSPTATPNEIMQQSQIFFENFAPQLAATTPEEFAAFKEGLVTLLLEKAKNMPEKAGQFWQEITVGRYSFDTRSAIAEQVKTLTLDDIITLYNDAITEKKFSWAVFSKGGDIENLTPLSEQNRSQLPAFPRPDLTAIPTTN